MKDAKLEDTTKEKVVKKFGKPCLKIVNDFHWVNIMILFYKVKIGSNRTKLELHFVSENGCYKLFYFSYTFRYLKYRERAEYLDIVLNKYGVPGDFDIKNDYILDRNHNALSVKNSLDFKIEYIKNLDSDFFSDIRNYVDRKKKINEVKLAGKRKEVFERL